MYRPNSLMFLRCLHSNSCSNFLGSSEFLRVMVPMTISQDHPKMFYFPEADLLLVEVEMFLDSLALEPILDPNLQKYNLEFFLLNFTMALMVGKFLILFKVQLFSKCL